MINVLCENDNFHYILRATSFSCLSERFYELSMKNVRILKIGEMRMITFFINLASYFGVTDYRLVLLRDVIK